MSRFIGRRVLWAIATVFATSILVFVATHLLPGDAAKAILGLQASPARVATLRRQLGLDQSLVVQYLHWIRDFFTGSFGQSVASGESVISLLGPRVVNTLTLVVATGIVAIPLAFGLGCAAAAARDSWFDRTSSALILFLAALPEFVVAIAVIELFSVGVLHLFPAVSQPAQASTVLGDPKVIVLPALALILLVVPYMARMVRATMTEVLDSEYCDMARLNGIGPVRLLSRHALPNVLAPSAQVVALILAYLTGGIVIVESVFAYPGIGSGLVHAVQLRDVNQIQFIAMLIATTYIGVYLLADIVTVAVTPRLRVRPR